MAVRRIVAYAGGHELIASRDFYVEVLGMQVAMDDPVLDLRSPDNPTAEVIIGAQEMQGPQPSFGVDVGDPAAVDAAHAEVVRRGLRVVYPLTDEPWGRSPLLRRRPGRDDRQRARAHRLTSTTERLRQRPASRTRTGRSSTAADSRSPRSGGALRDPPDEMRGEGRQTKHPPLLLSAANGRVGRSNPPRPQRTSRDIATAAGIDYWNR